MGEKRGALDIAPPPSSRFTPEFFDGIKFFMRSKFLAVLLVLGLSTCPAMAEASVMSASPVPSDHPVAGGSRLGSIAARYVGMTGPELGLASRLWCGAFLSMVRQKAGLRAPVSRRAADQAQHARRVAHPVAGAIVISGRRGGSHADLIASVHADGSVTLIRPNWSRRVVEQRVAGVRGAIYVPM